MTDNLPNAQDQQITSIADAVVKLKELKESNKNLNEPDIEERFVRLALGFRTDKFTLGKRLDLQLRQRDIAEKNIDNELKSLRESLNALNQLCTDSEMREVITKTQQHVDIVQQATMRMSSRAETYGAIQQEQRMNAAFETMLNYVEHLKLLYDKEHMELEEYRKLLAEHNLLPNDKSPEDSDDPKRGLPPRSQSLSSSSKSEYLKHGGYGHVLRKSTQQSIDGHKAISRENSSGHLSVPNVIMNVVKSNLDSKTKLLSAICLLNNNFESVSKTNAIPSSGEISPKSRRSSLPVGPSTIYSSSHNPLPSSKIKINENQKEITENVMQSQNINRFSRTESTDSEESSLIKNFPSQDSFRNEIAADKDMN